MRGDVQLVREGLGRVVVLGCKGMVGSTFCRILSNDTQNCAEVIGASRDDFDLLDAVQTFNFLKKNRPDTLIIAAAKVGGIRANNEFPVEFLRDNLLIEINAIESAFRLGIKKLLFLGSSCIYPKHADQPMQEQELLSGYLEPTNEAYALAKIAGIKLCEAYNRQHCTDFRSVMPTNLFGLGDNYDPELSHVIPGLIQRFHRAKIQDEKEVVVWGSGRVRREFLYADDLIDACLMLCSMPKSEFNKLIEPRLSHINIGSGVEVTIETLAEMIKKLVQYQGNIIFDESMPDGSPRKLVDCSTLKKLGWSPRHSLADGLGLAYSDYIRRYN